MSLLIITTTIIIIITIDKPSSVANTQITFNTQHKKPISKCHLNRTQYWSDQTFGDNNNNEQWPFEPWNEWINSFQFWDYFPLWIVTFIDGYVNRIGTQIGEVNVFSWITYAEHDILVEDLWYLILNWMNRTLVCQMILMNAFEFSVTFCVQSEFSCRWPSFTLRKWNMINLFMHIS